MVFNPYQSSLLRFVVGQYRQGVARHRSAFGQAHAKVKLSAELGTALIVLPIYVAARGSILAGRKLRQTLIQPRFKSLKPQIRKLLNFSGFESVGSLSTRLNADSVSRDAIRGSAQPIFQTLIAVGDCLSSAQIKVLSEPEPDPLAPDGLGTPDSLGQSRLVRWVDRWRTAARQLLRFDSGRLRVGSTVELDRGRGALSSPAQITGVASDLRTRSLLLILDYSAVWNGLSADQQLRLQHQIMAFLSDGSINDRSISNGSIKLPSKSRALNFFSRSGLVARWMRKDKKLIQPFDPWMKPIKPVVSNGSRIALNSESDLDCLTIQRREATRPFTKSAPIAVVKPARLMATATLPDQLLRSEKSDRKPGRETLEADVVSVTYVEHPLEKMLKWVDRILLWIEKKWQWVNQWIQAILHQ